MDTNDLSRNAYDAVLATAERFNHDLTLQFGCLAYDCRTEEEYLDEAEGLIDYWLQADDIEELMLDIFFGERVGKKEFVLTLRQIKKNIEEVRRIPEDKREDDF